MAFRLAGININQEDDPWWIVGILNWLGMYKAISEGYGDAGKNFRMVLVQIFDQGAPFLQTNKKNGKQRVVYGANALYGIYADFCDTVLRESQK